MPDADDGGDGLIGRRSFLRRLGEAAVALTLARHLPGIAPSAPVVPPPVLLDRVLLDRETGISMRFVQNYDVQGEKWVNRFDVFMAMPVIMQPDFAVRVQG